MIDTRRRNLVVAAVLLAMLLAALDQTIVSTALPTMVTELGGGAHLSWVVTSYLLAETVMTVLIGKFGDLYGRKKTFLVSADDGVATLDEIAEMTKVPGGIFAPTARALVESGHLTAHDDGYRFTERGADVFTQLVRAWRRWLVDQLEDWHEPDQRDFARALDSFTDELIESGRRLSRV